MKISAEVISVTRSISFYGKPLIEAKLRFAADDNIQSLLGQIVAIETNGTSAYVTDKPKPI